MAQPPSAVGLVIFPITGSPTAATLHSVASFAPVAVNALGFAFPTCPACPGVAVGRSRGSPDHRCALTSSRVLHVLDSAHIKPYASSGAHSPTNGMLLRQDIHTLFDLGYITVTPQYKVEISNRMKEEFENGKEYYSMHGRQINLPNVEQFRPSEKMLEWHNQNIFLG